MTGTPIQNRLEDLAALLSFLRPEYFGTVKEFRRFLLPNFRNDEGDPYKNIRLLLDSICLRRPKDILEIPPTHERLLELDFSPSELTLYDQMKASMLRSIDQPVYQRSSACKAFGLFQMNLRLRRVCNHGTYEKDPTSTQSRLAFDQEQHLTSIQQEGNAKCKSCRIRILGSDSIAATTETTFTACGHLLCISCATEFASTIERQKQSGDPLRCPLCSTELGEEYFLSSAKPDISQTNPSSTGLRLDGVSTKVSQLLKDISNGPHDAKRYVPAVSSEIY